MALAGGRGLGARGGPSADDVVPLFNKIKMKCHGRRPAIERTDDIFFEFAPCRKPVSVFPPPCGAPAGGCGVINRRRPLQRRPRERRARPPPRPPGFQTKQ